jgi:hypothetical protein
MEFFARKVWTTSAVWTGALWRNWEGVGVTVTVVDATADSRAGAGGTGKSESHPNGPPQQYFFNHATSPSTRVRNKRVLQFVCERTPYVGAMQNSAQLWSVLVFMNIVLRLKSWYLAEKQVFPSKHSRGGICTSHTKKWKQTWLGFWKLLFSYDLRKSL